MGRKKGRRGKKAEGRKKKGGDLNTHWAPQKV